jgi:hypothetical protein
MLGTTFAVTDIQMFGLDLKNGLGRPLFCILVLMVLSIEPS